ncbi:MAG: DUF2845 domain-containing protein [Spiribacter salinus]|uniref:DUF2845 domain-containing protein n=1 Tax=Spiribacter salinus TaxID=1335746 RepID=A0A540VPN9_9GAMM|nr:MAG: DUF2845 domain-containing protein [Spiribacter salinus]
MNKSLPCGVATLAALLSATPASADSLRCGQSLVQPGDHITEVVQDCGEPDRTTNIVNNEGVRIGTKATYTGDDRTHTRIVVYRGDQVIRVEVIR